MTETQSPTVRVITAESTEPASRQVIFNPRAARRSEVGAGRFAAPRETSQRDQG
uniref:hypothetical protein n=1 Tax=Paractinoplanes polyasparticus TaxID=2856853 RepID=UPI001C8656AE|nr:hypothetical protein [Actinoplanes polyasparticus]